MKIDVLYQVTRRTPQPRTNLGDLGVGDTFVFASAYYNRLNRAPALYMVVKGGFTRPGTRKCVDLNTGNTFVHEETRPVIRYQVKGNRAQESK